MRRFLLHWLVTALALYAAVQVVPGITYEGGWVVLVSMALVFGLVNAIVRPILRLLTCPLIILSLGLFSLVINGLMLLLASRTAELLGVHFFVDGFWPAFWGAVVVSMVGALLNILLRPDQEDEHRPRSNR